MITKFEMYESLSVPPKVGDYVMIDDELYKYSYVGFYEYVKTAIGHIISTGIEHGGAERYYTVKFEDIPEELKFHNYNFFYKDDTRKCTTSNLKCWSSDIEDLEAQINSKKYNI